MKAMKKGFTLAEVLITLAIIGVVAALTIPTVVTNYKAKALETQKKKAMSVLVNGFRLLMAEDNVTELANTKIAACGENDKTCLANEFKRAFNVIADNTSENSIFNTEYHFAGRSYDLWNDPAIKYVFVTSDGMIFGLDLLREDGKSHGSIAGIKVDVSGVKNPNKGGQDLCRYVINNEGKIIDYSSEMAVHCGTPKDGDCNRCNTSGCNESQCVALSSTDISYEWSEGRCRVVSSGR